jgi:hypothetical protein
MSAQVSPVEMRTGNGTEKCSESPKSDLFCPITVFTIPRKYRKRNIM